MRHLGEVLRLAAELADSGELDGLTIAYTVGAQARAFSFGLADQEHQLEALRQAIDADIEGIALEGEDTTHAPSLEIH